MTFRWNIRKEMNCINEGEIIICGHCDAKIAKAKETIRHGFALNAAAFEGIQKPIKAGDLMICNCGQPYYSPDAGFMVLNE